MRHTVMTIAFTLGLFLGACSSPSYSIRVVDGLPKETYLTFSKGSPVQVGEIYVLFHLQQAPASSGAGHGGHGGHGGGGTMNLKHEIGKVQVVKITDDIHALVKVLSGYVEDGVRAEKTQ